MVLKLTFCFRKLEGNIDESVINSPQSQFITERNGAMKFEIYLGNVLMLGLFTVQLLIFSILYVLTSFKELVQKEIVQFCIQLFRFKMNLILPMIKTTRKSMVFGLLKHKS